MSDKEKRDHWSEYEAEPTCDWCSDLLSNHTLERLSACKECLSKNRESFWSQDGQTFFPDGSDALRAKSSPL